MQIQENNKGANSSPLLDRYGQPCKVDAFYLSLSWAVSKGRDTYGYNICRLDAPGYHTPDVYHQAERFKTMGGGYDMVGTVIGDWLQSHYQDRLKALHERAMAEVRNKEYKSRSTEDTLYGMVAYYAEAGHLIKIDLDGACGDSSMETIAKAIGVHWSYTSSRKGHRTGLMVTDYGSAENAKAMGRE